MEFLAALPSWSTDFGVWISEAYYEVEFLSEFIDSILLVEVIQLLSNSCELEQIDRTVSPQTLQNDIQNSRTAVPQSLAILEQSFCVDSSGFQYRFLLDYEFSRLKVQDCLPSVAGILFNGAATTVLPYLYPLLDYVYDRKDQGKLEGNQEYVLGILDNITPVNKLYAFVGLQNIDETWEAFTNLINNLDDIDIDSVLDSLNNIYEQAQGFCDNSLVVSLLSFVPPLSSFCDDLENGDYGWIPDIPREDLKTALTAAMTNFDSISTYRLNFEMFVEDNQDIIDDVIFNLRRLVEQTFESANRRTHQDGIEVLDRINETSGETCEDIVLSIQERNEAARNQPTNASTLAEYMNGRRD